MIDGPQSVVFDQAENRLWAQEALLARLLSRPSIDARRTAGQLPLPIVLPSARG